MPAYVWIPVALAAIAVFSIAVRFDLNAYLTERKRLQYVRLQTMCPHAVLDRDEDGTVFVRSLVQSPPLTFEAKCNRCHRIFRGGLAETDDQDRYWAANPKAWAKAEKRFRRYGRRKRLVVRS